MRKILLMAGILIFAMGMLALGFHAGKMHVLRDEEISVSGNVVTITIDGDVYEHVAE